MFAFRDAQRSAVSLFGTIFLDDMAQNQAVVLYSDTVSHLILTSCLLNCCIKSISHLQTPLIIFKSCHSQFYRDLWEHRKWSRERASEFSFIQKHVQMIHCVICHRVISTEPAGMSRIIFNSRKPTSKFKSCSVFSANNPTVNASSVSH